MTTSAPVAPAPSASATEVFGDRLPAVRAFADLLAGPGVERGLLGPREAPRLWERHLLNCVGVSSLLDDGLTVLDLGSGAGLPGLVLALTRPELTLVLVEPMQRRATFLEEAVTSLGLRNVVVRRSRAEELAGKVMVDAVVARAVAPLDRLAAWALPLLGPGGRLLALKGDSAATELAGAGAALRRSGASGGELLVVGDPALGTQAAVVVVTRGTAVAPARDRPVRASSGPAAISGTRRRQGNR